ncbi:MAG TPA: exosortase E/protease, VPEID-CTERM system [Bryobacteraceae bacterium]|jgi:exosortase E/protease (VPEID-CTERM system)|nr:exosortase E/protease, VPEID-CTERM system [Bryobacteraceae bacterium]
MQAQLTPVVETAPPAALRLPARLALLGILFAIEILLISYWLDTELLRGRGILATILHDWGAWFVRLGVAIALGSLIFAESRAKTDLKRISAECASSPIGWSIFAAHAASMLLFIWLSSAMFHATAGTFLNSQVLVWGCTGLLSFALAACALIPARVWVEIARSTGDAWIYGLGGALVACAFGVLAQKLWIPLSHGTFNLVALMLRPFVAVLLVDPSNMSIGTPTFHVEIAPECSGYEGMGLILAFSSAWLWFFRRQWRFPQALILIPAGVALLWIANAVRIAALILIGNAGAPQIAIGGFHSEAGWIAFNAVAIGTCLLARRIPALVHDLPQSDTTNPTAPYLMPFLAILGAAMIAHALSAGFEWFYSLRIVAAAGALWYFRESYRDLNWRFGWIGAAAGALVFAIWMGFEKTFHSPAPAALMQASGAARIAWIALRIVGGVLIVPVAEELAFRGFLLRRLASPDFESVSWRTFSWAPFLISSIAFGIMHGDRWLAGTIAGAIFALVQIRRGRIGDAVLAHSVANALVAAWVLGAGDWNLW